MTVVTGAGLGTGSGLGAESAVRTASGIDAGKGLAAALAGVGRDAATGNEAPVTGKENFKANWQSILRTCGVSARAGNETVQSAWAARENNGSTASVATLASNAVRANQPEPAANGTIVAAGTQSASARRATKAADGIENTPVSSKIKNRVNDRNDAGAQGQAVQGADGTTGSPVVESGLAAQAVITLQMSAPPAQSSHSVPDLSGEVDDRVDGRTTITNQPAPSTTLAANEGKGTSSAMPSMAVTTPTGSARAAGQIPIHTAQTSPSGHAMNSGAAAAIEQQNPQHVDEQEDFSTSPHAYLTTTGIATARSPKPASVIDAGANSEIGERKAAVGGFAAHPAAGETGGTSAAAASLAAATEKPSAENDANTPQPPAMQSAHEAAGKANAAIPQQTGAHVAIAQNPGAETSAFVRDPGGAHGTANTPATIGRSSAGPAPTPQETFAALDAGSTVGAPSWVHAGGRQAEAGFEDPALGWVGVRADVTGGSVHAALVPGSTEAAEALGGHFAGLSTYLSENHTPVATLTMAAPGNGATDAGSDPGQGRGMNQGMQQGAGESGEQRSATVPQPGTGASATISSTDSSTQINGIDATLYARDGLGRHISVMA